ncbi:LuxR C-terminal-related transcriptional regulator [Micromonospora sp. NPDC047074]|uniref:helix-turn-helix transcriptional regulator n=1 Tax=Micromonospora sp. NPDC047074 TaxID=3154339 RepID=UPI0033F14EFC
MGRAWPFTGRQDELRSIEIAIRTNAGHGILLAGPAGVGKTRLAREAVALAQQQGATTRWIAGTASSRGLALGAFAGLLGVLRGDPTGLVTEAVQAFLSAASNGQVILGVDDAHLLDDMSALLVHQLVVQGAVVAVATMRTGEAVPDLVTRLWQEGHIERFEVGPLGQQETGSLLEAVLGGPVERTTVGRVWEFTRGNLLYLRHFVAGEVEARRLQSVRGIWRWSGEALISPGLTDLVTIRMGELTEPERLVVDVLALAEPLDVRLLAGLTDPSAIERTEESGLIRVEDVGRRLEARLAHPLFGEVRRARMGTLRARRLRGRVSQALADAGYRQPDDILRRAVLAVDSDLEPDRRLLIEAGRRAGQLCDLPMAVRLGRAAQAAGGGFEASMIVLGAFNGLSRPTGADFAVLTAAAGTDAELVRATMARAIDLAWMASRPAEAEAILDAADDQITGSDGSRQLMALRALFDGQLARPARAIEAAATALDSPLLPDESVLLATTGYVIGLATVGRADELATLVTQGAAAAGRAAQYAFLRFPLITAQLLGLRLAGYLRKAADVAHDCWESARGLELPTAIASVLMGDVLLAQGRPVSALRWLREAYAGFEPFDGAGGFEHVCLIPLVRALALTGELTAATEASAKLLAREHPMIQCLRPDLLLSQAWLAAAQGVSSEAIALAREAASVAAATGQCAHEVLALHTATCLGDRSGVERLTALSQQVDGPRAQAAAAHAIALASDNGDALQSASDMLERMGDPLAAADAAAQATIAYRRAQQRGAAYQAEARVRRLIQTCEGVGTPATRATVRPLPLTGREREIGALAAQGMSNREIAHRLVVSVRTVENHLYRINTKLGISSRAGLVEVLGSHCAEGTTPNGAGKHAGGRTIAARDASD